MGGGKGEQKPYRGGGANFLPGAGNVAFGLVRFNALLLNFLPPFAAALTMPHQFPKGGNFLITKRNAPPKQDYTMGATSGHG